MKRASEVLGLKVLGIKEGLENGIAQDLMIDPEDKKVEYLILKTNQGYGFKAIRIEDITGIGGDYIMTHTVENAKKMYESKEILEDIEKGFFILGTTVLASTGDIAGHVEDFSFDEKDGSIVTLYLENQSEFDGTKIVTMAGKMVFVDPQGVEMFQREEQPKEPEEQQTGLEEPQEPEADTAEVQQKPDHFFESETLRFLFGKTVKETVSSEAGSLTIEAGTVLDETILRQAVQHSDILLSLTMSV